MKSSVKNLLTGSSVLDLTPDAFSFIDITGAISATYYSNQVTVTGMSANASITVSVSFSNGSGGIDAATSTLLGTYSSSKTVTTSASGTIVVKIQMVAPATTGSTATATVTIGGVSSSWRITSRSPDITPNSFLGTSYTGLNLNTYYQTGLMYIGGLEPNYLINLSISGASGRFPSYSNATSVQISSDSYGQVPIVIEAKSAATLSTSAVTYLTVGDTTNSWTLVTKAV